MNERELEPTIRRILVALDASPHSLAALEAASELADALKAELVGIFVEDVNLLASGRITLRTRDWISVRVRSASG